MPSKRKPASKYHTSRILWAILLLLFIGILSVGYSSQGRYSGAFKLATSHMPEKYTELYFNSPAKLPLYSPARKYESVPFTIVNHEARTETYTYQASLDISGAVSSSRQTVTLKDGQSAALLATMMIPTPSTPAILTIKLLGTDNQLTLKSTS